MTTTDLTGLASRFGQHLLSYLRASSSKERRMLKYHRYMLVRCLPAFLAIQKLYAAHWRAQDEEFIMES